MDYKNYGSRLKKAANSNGNLVSVDINNIYNIMEVLSHFFYRKHHEWIAICFIDNNYCCKNIWFNKGPDHTSVNIKLTPEEIVEHAKKINVRYILISHNHPASSKMIPTFSSKRKNIQANKELQREIFDFSDQDLKSADHYSSFIQANELGFAEAVFVAGNYKIYGNKNIIENYENNRMLYNYQQQIHDDLLSNSFARTGCLIQIIIFCLILSVILL